MPKHSQHLIVLRTIKDHWRITIGINWKQLNPAMLPRVIRDNLLAMIFLDGVFAKIIRLRTIEVQENAIQKNQNRKKFVVHNDAN